MVAVVHVTVRAQFTVCMVKCSVNQVPIQCSRWENYNYYIRITVCGVK